MNTEFNLCKILKGHEGKTFYSPVFGTMTLNKINPTTLDFIGGNNELLRLLNDGRFNIKADEIAVYPSDSLRDWNVWNKEVNDKLPKTWSEFENKNNEPTYNLSIIDKYGLDKEIVELSPIEKAAIALLKIYKLIEIGYGGNITDEEYSKLIECYYIQYNLISKKFEIYRVLASKFHVAFHTQEQAAEFISHSENIQLLKDYSMITD